jgi:hypothetical protein
MSKTNGLMEKISEYFKDGKVDQEDMPAYSELKRHLGFGYNGMVLHQARQAAAFITMGIEWRQDHDSRDPSS